MLVWFATRFFLNLRRKCRLAQRLMSVVTNAFLGKHILYTKLYLKKHWCWCWQLFALDVFFHLTGKISPISRSKDRDQVLNLQFATYLHSWWRHQMETFSALLALCVGNSPVTSEFPSQRPVTRSFDVFFDLGVIKPLRHRWFESLIMTSLYENWNAFL